MIFYYHLTMNTLINELNIKTFVLYYDNDEYEKMGKHEVTLDIIKHINYYENEYNIKYKDLIKTKKDEYIKIEIIME